MVFKGLGVFLYLSAMGLAGDAARVSVTTVGVEPRTGRLVRRVVARPVTSKAVPEKVVEAREVPSKEPDRNVISRRFSDDWISELAYNYGIRPSFVHAVIKAESNYDPRAISSKGALGLMQLMPQTARRFGVKNVFNPVDNVEGGVRYLRHLLDLYDTKSALTLAAYNAGEGAVDRYGGVPPYAETRQFVQRVNRYYSRYLANEKPLVPAPRPKRWEGPQIYQTTDASGLTRYTTNPE